MRFITLRIFYILSLAYIFSSCSVSKMHNKKGWDIISKGLFGKTNTSDEINVTVVTALNHFDKAIFWDRHSWVGYAGKAQTFRFTYFLYPDILPQKKFLQKIIEVYELWFANNQKDKKHLIPYAVTLYVDGQEQEALQIFTECYKKDYRYDLSFSRIDEESQIDKQAHVVVLKSKTIKTTCRHERKIYRGFSKENHGNDFSAVGFFVCEMAAKPWHITKLLRR